MGVTGRRVRIAGGIAGILFVVIALVAFLLPGAPPKANEAAAKVTSYFISKRSSILAGEFLVGIAVTFFLLFVGALRVHLGAAGRDGIRPGAAVLSGGAAGAALLLAGGAVTNAAVFHVASAGDANLNLALYDISSDLFFMSGFGFAAFFLGAALAGYTTGALPAALAPAAALAALIQIVSAIGLFAKSGFLANGGAFGYIAVLSALLWVLVASVVLLRLGTSEPAAAAAAPAGQ